MAEGQVIDADLEFIKFLKRSGGADLKKCYQCATCASVCGLSAKKSPFPRKEMLLAGWGQAEKLARDPDVWLCYQCNDCSTYCPRGAKPGDVLAAVRAFIYERFAVPRFMGRALASPAALPLLFLVPIIVMGVMLLSRKPELMAEDIVFDHFINVHWLEPLFIAGNILVFACAFLGLFNFWKALKPEVAEMGFVGGVVSWAKDILSHGPGVVKDILTHGDFFDCDANRPRAIAHLLVFFGFFGAALTAGMGAMALKVMGIESPYTLDHPLMFVKLIKVFGNLAAVSGIAGTAWLLVRRFSDPEAVGANGYQDKLFLIVIFLTFVTGFLTQVVRLSGAQAAYLVYYVHLVIVFFLLWYAPYSKFGHMFYRTVALIYARSVGRERDKRAA